MSKQMSWWHFERTGKHYRYQPGFHSKRPVTFPDGTKSGTLLNKIYFTNTFQVVILTSFQQQKVPFSIHNKVTLLIQKWILVISETPSNPRSNNIKLSGFEGFDCNERVIFKG